MGIPSTKRLRKSRDFQKIREHGTRMFLGPFIVQYCQRMSNEESRRLGVIASRRVGNAVKRNRGKRIVRELFRLHESVLPDGCDIVIVLRSNFDRYSFSDLEARYVRACANLAKERPAGQACSYNA
jgi:ribonuclease P protein component